MVKLEDYTIGELKKMISSFNKLVKFSGYSKLPKAKLITMIRTHPKINVEEGANAVKLSIKTDEDFEKQKKVKKEKVKKEVKKEVEKLDDVKVVVKPVAKAEEPEKKKFKFKVKAKKEPEEQELGEFKLDNGFKVKDYDKKKLFNFYRDIYIKFYGKDNSYITWTKDEEREKRMKLKKKAEEKPKKKFKFKKKEPKKEKEK